MNRAIRILSDRFVRDTRAVTALTKDVFSRFPSTRARAHILLSMLEKHASDTGPIQFLSQSGVSTGRDGVVLFNTVPRSHEESFEEQELRRRRREAVVFHDGGGPVRQDDIIQRSANGVPVRRERDEALENALRDMTAGTG